MSVTTTSKMALSSLRLAASPELTVSTLWPSRRKAMSSISQMERSSSQTRMLPMAHLLRRRLHAACADAVHRRQWLACQSNSRSEAAQAQNEFASLSELGSRPDLAVMGLHDLIDDGQSKARATFKVRLKRLEDFFRQLRTDSRPGIGKADLPVLSDSSDRNGKRAPGFHGANRVFTEVPEHLFQFVAVRQHNCVTQVKMAFRP